MPQRAMSSGDSAGGTRALERGLHLLCLLGRHHDAGLTMSQAGAQAGLETSTAHRILQSLVRQGFAEKDAAKRYRLGWRAQELGAAVRSRPPLVDHFRPLLQRLARMTGDTVFLMARDGDEAVCIHREQGPRSARSMRTAVATAACSAWVSAGWH